MLKRTPSPSVFFSANKYNIEKREVLQTIKFYVILEHYFFILYYQPYPSRHSKKKLGFDLVLFLCLNLTNLITNNKICTSKRGGDTMIQMTYKNKKGEIIRRTINTGSPYKIGDTNSFGWTVLDIKYLYKGKYYSKKDYDSIVDSHYNKMRRRTKIRSFISRLYSSMVYLVELMIAVRVFEIISNIAM